MLSVGERHDFDICGEASTKGLYYYWAPADQIANGRQTAQNVLDRARTASIVNGYLIVRSLQSTPEEVHYALCSVPIVEGANGPPRNCATVAIFTERRIWLRGGPRHTGLCFAAAEFRNTGAIDITYNVVTHLRVQQFEQSLLKLLQSDLGMKAEERSRYEDGKYVSIESASGLRVSSILGGGWREAVDFDISLGEEESGRLSFHGTAHVAICRQAVGSLTEYQGLDDAQRATYASKLDTAVAAALKMSCKNATQRDSRTIACN